MKSYEATVGAEASKVLQAARTRLAGPQREPTSLHSLLPVPPSTVEELVCVSFTCFPFPHCPYVPPRLGVRLVRSVLSLAPLPLHLSCHSSISLIRFSARYWIVPGRRWQPRLQLHIQQPNRHRQVNCVRASTSCKSA